MDSARKPAKPHSAAMPTAERESRATSRPATTAAVPTVPIRNSSAPGYPLLDQHLEVRVVGGHGALRAGVAHLAQPLPEGMAVDFGDGVAGGIPAVAQGGVTGGIHEHVQAVAELGGSLRRHQRRPRRARQHDRHQRGGGQLLAPARPARREPHRTQAHQPDRQGHERRAAVAADDRDQGQQRHGQRRPAHVAPEHAERRAEHPDRHQEAHHRHRARERPDRPERAAVVGHRVLGDGVGPLAGRGADGHAHRRIAAHQRTDHDQRPGQPLAAAERARRQQRRQADSHVHLGQAESRRRRVDVAGQHHLDQRQRQPQRQRTQGQPLPPAQVPDPLHGRAPVREQHSHHRQPERQVDHGGAEGVRFHRSRHLLPGQQQLERAFETGQAERHGERRSGARSASAATSASVQPAATRVGHAAAATDQHGGRRDRQRSAPVAARRPRAKRALGVRGCPAILTGRRLCRGRLHIVEASTRRQNPAGGASSARLGPPGRALDAGGGHAPARDPGRLAGLLRCAGKHALGRDRAGAPAGAGATHGADGHRGRPVACAASAPVSAPGLHRGPGRSLVLQLFSSQTARASTLMVPRPWPAGWRWRRSMPAALRPGDAHGDGARRGGAAALVPPPVAGVEVGASPGHRTARASTVSDPHRSCSWSWTSSRSLC